MAVTGRHESLYTMFSQFFFSPLHPRYVKVAQSAATIVQKDVETLVANGLTGNRWPNHGRQTQTILKNTQLWSIKTSVDRPIPPGTSGGKASLSSAVCGLERFLPCWFIGICRHQWCLELVFPPAYGQFFCGENKPSLCFSLSSSARSSIHPRRPRSPSSPPVPSPFWRMCVRARARGSHVLMTERDWLSEWGIKKSKHSRGGQAAAIDRWATALGHNGRIQSASGDGYPPSGLIFDTTKVGRLFDMLGVLFSAGTAICGRSQLRRRQQVARDQMQRLRSPFLMSSTAAWLR